MDSVRLIEQLREEGFTPHAAEDISKQVFPHFRRHWRRTADAGRQEAVLRSAGASPAVARQSAQAWRRQMRMLMLTWPLSDYCIVAGCRPGGQPNPDIQRID